MIGENSETMLLGHLDFVEAAIALATPRGCLEKSKLVKS